MSPRTPGRDDAVAAADELLTEVDDLRREQHEEREYRGRLGSVARELDLRALLAQHYRAFTAFVALGERLAFVVYPKFGYQPTRSYCLTYLVASINSLGRPCKVARWRISDQFENPFMFRRYVDPGTVGQIERTWFAHYVEDWVFAPATDALWRQLGGMDQEPRPT